MPGLILPASKGFINMKEKAIKIAKNIPNGKIYFELITAALSVPVLISVLLLNYNNINNKPKPTASPTPTPTAAELNKIIYITQPASNNPTPVNNCIKDIGPVKISFPADGQTITDNPVNFDISYPDSKYCSVVWSYRINNGSWSSYTANNPVIYNLPNGKVIFDLKVQSTVVQKEISVERNFVYSGNSNPTPQATSSAQ